MATRVQNRVLVVRPDTKSKKITNKDRSIALSALLGIAVRELSKYSSKRAGEIEAQAINLTIDWEPCSKCGG